MTRITITSCAHGVDFSQWQRQWVYTSTTGQIDFGIAKISEGAWVDPNFKENLFIGGLDRLPVQGLYHYQRSGVSWQTQAKNFLAAANGLPSRVHILAIDVEKGNNTMDAAYFADSRRIYEYLLANSSYRVVIYANEDVLVNSMYPIVKKAYGVAYAAWLHDVPLWFAQYHALTVPPVLPSWRTKPHRIWQYSDKGGREYGTPDLDVFNGTLDEMKTWAGAAVSPVVTPAPEKVISVSETKLNELAAAVTDAQKQIDGVADRVTALSR